MTFLRMGAEGPDIPCCGYPGSRLRFRGPARSLEGPYVAALGGAATFGKGVARPWPALLEAATGRTVVNLGAVGAGPEAAAQDAGVLAICRGAAAVAVEVGAVGAVPNALYRVHPRRNDRVVAVEPALGALFPGLDLQGVAFVGHLLDTLAGRDAGAFATVLAGLEAAWTARMGALLDRVAGPPVVLVRLSDRPLEVPGPRAAAQPVPRAALVPLLPRLAGVVAGAGHRPPGARPALPDAAAHEAAAAALAPLLHRLGVPAEAPGRRAAG